MDSYQLSMTLVMHTFSQSCPLPSLSFLDRYINAPTGLDACDGEVNMHIGSGALPGDSCSNDIFITCLPILEWNRVHTHECLHVMCPITNRSTDIGLSLFADDVCRTEVHSNGIHDILCKRKDADETLDTHKSQKIRAES
jgi:hypothetical protein